MLLTVFIKARIFSELCFLFLCHVRCARSFTPLAPPSPPLLGFLSTPLPPWTRWTASPTQVNQMLRSPQPSNQLEPVTLITAQRYVERIPSWMRLFSPSCLSSRCFTGLFLCHWALHHRTASCWKTKQKKLPLSPNQKQKIHQTCSFSLSFSLFAVCEALLPGQRNLSDSEKHSRETRPPADQGDTLFILSSFLLPLLPAWNSPFFSPLNRKAWLLSGYFSSFF